MAVPTFQVDAFTDRPFSGNPAAVCLLNEPRSDEWMQSVAAEMNLPETAVVQPTTEGFGLRWFTPTVEVDLCGHATLAAAHVLWQSERLDVQQPARFHTRSGLLTACRKDGWIELDFPATPATPVETPTGLADAVGCSPRFVGRSQFDYLAEVDSEDVVRAIRPDFAVLAEIPSRGVIITSKANGDYDFVSRFFAPASGIDEDPVTGSAHCCLGPFWAERLGKTEFLAYQASARGGEMRVRVEGERVFLAGKAVTVLKGEIV